MDAAQVSLYGIIVPDLARWLPEPEAAAFRTAIEAELARFHR